jgi:TolC family type I secretion outer membrane protein
MTRTIVIRIMRLLGGAGGAAPWGRHGRWRLVLPVVAAALVPAAGAAQTITDALASAYVFNPALKSALARLDATNEQRPQALSGWLPTITVSTGLTRNGSAEPSIVGPSGRYNGIGESINVTQPIMKGITGQYSQMRAAEDSIRTARANFLATEEAVLTTAATAYIDVWTNQRIVAAERRNVHAIRAMLNLVHQQVVAGDRTIPDQTLTELQLKNAEASLTTAVAVLDAARSRYRQAAGRRAPTALTAPGPLPTVPKRLAMVRTLARTVNPTVVASVYSARAARDNVDQAIAALLPSLSLVASFQRNRISYARPYGALSGYYGTSQIELVLSVPLYQGGYEYSRVRQARKTADALAMDRASAKLNAVSQAEQDWSQRQGAIAAVRQYRAATRIAANLVTQYRREVAAGETTAFEALNGLTSQVSTELQLFLAERDRVLADYALLADTGRLTARDLKLHVPYLNPDGDYDKVKWKVFGFGTR